MIGVIYHLDSVGASGDGGDLVLENLSAQRAIDWTLLQTALITIVACILLMLAFVLLRRYVSFLYNMKVIDGKYTWFNFFKPVFNTSNNAIFQRHGLDAVVFMLFSQAILYCTIGFFIYGFVILLPVDITATNKDLPDSDVNKVSGTAILSYSNINHIHESNRYVAHLISVMLNTLVCLLSMYNFLYNYKYYVFLYRCEFHVENFAVLLSRVPAHIDEEDLVKTCTEANSGVNVMSIHRVHRYGKIDHLLRKRGELLEKLELAELECNKDNYKEYLNELHVLDSKIENTQICHTDSAFVVFDKEHISGILEQKSFKIEGENGTVSASKASDIGNVIWSSYSHDNLSHLYRKFFISLAFCIILIFWSSTMFLLKKFIDDNFISKFLNHSENKTSFGNKFSMFVLQMIPPLSVTLMSVVFRSTFYYIVKFEVFSTYASRHNSHFRKLFLFYICAIFLSSVLSGTYSNILDRLKQLQNNLIDTLYVLGVEVSKQVNFFINYSMINLLVNFIFLLQPYRLLKRMAYLYVPLKSFKLKRVKNWLNTRGCFHYHYEYAELLLIFMIGMTYSSLSALITPFVFLYTLIKYYAARYFIMYCHEKRYEGYGKIAMSSMNRVIFCLLLYNISMAGIFLASEFIVGTIICIIVSSIVVIFWILVLNSNYSWSDYKSKNGSIRKFPEELKDVYRDPIYDLVEEKTTMHGDMTKKRIIASRIAHLYENEDS